MRPTLCLLLFLSFSAHLAAQTDPIAAGDAAWARRADGHQGARAIPGPVDEAIAAYERAVKEQPERLEGTWKLLRALHFKGDFTTNSNDARQKAFARGKEVAEAGIDRLAKRTAGSRQKLDAMSPAQAAKAVAGVPEAKPLYLWAAVHWGLWGDVFGRLAAARQGVGDRVKTYSETLIALDERYEDAGGHRIDQRLSRAHAIQRMRERASRHDAKHHADHSARDGEERSLSHDQPNDTRRLGAKRDTQAQLARSL